MEIFLKKIINRDLGKIILAMLLVELFSMASFKIDWLSAFFLLIISLITLLFTLYKLEYGLYILWAELLIGSWGYLFFIPLGSFRLPVRIGIFVVVFMVWLIKYWRPRKYWQLFRTNHLWQILAIYFLFVGWGIISGLINHQGLSDIFLDFNNYLFFGLLGVFYEVFNSNTQKAIVNFFKIFLASLIYLSAKVFLTLYIFSHGLKHLSPFFYTWIRDTRVGEMVWAGGNFFRIFFQSQIYSLQAIFIISCLLAWLIITKDQKFKVIVKNKYFLALAGILILVETSILISFTRTFWLAMLCGLIIFLIYFIWQLRRRIKLFGQILIVSGVAAIISLSLMFLIANFPIPKPAGAFTVDMLRNRFRITGEAAVSSRWNLLPVLINQIKDNPWLGTGYGTKVTYQTEDPRYKNETNPEGWLTTFTFEWGYLDIVTEIGILGLLIYLLFIGWIFILGWQRLQEKDNQFIVLGLLLGLVVLLITHTFSPYLSHPLGIVYLLFCASYFSQRKNPPSVKKDGFVRSGKLSG